MNADAFRHFYDYHLNENRKIWNEYVLPLTQAQFTQPVAYSFGSVCNQIVHMVNVDSAWFSDLRGAPHGPFLEVGVVEDREAIRAHWDRVEQEMREYLASLRDDMLLTKPFPPGEDGNLVVWQVLLHVVNHGTDHRAQLLRVLHDLGVQTEPQDYIFYVYDNP